MVVVLAALVLAYGLRQALRQSQSSRGDAAIDARRVVLVLAAADPAYDADLATIRGRLARELIGKSWAPSAATANGVVRVNDPQGAAVSVTFHPPEAEIELYERMTRRDLYRYELRLAPLAADGRAVVEVTGYAPKAGCEAPTRARYGDACREWQRIHRTSFQLPWDGGKPAARYELRQSQWIDELIDLVPAVVLKG